MLDYTTPLIFFLIFSALAYSYWPIAKAIFIAISFFTLPVWVIKWIWFFLSEGTDNRIGNILFKKFLFNIFWYVIPVISYLTIGQIFNLKIDWPYIFLFNSFTIIEAYLIIGYVTGNVACNIFVARKLNKSSQLILNWGKELKSGKYLDKKKQAIVGSLYYQQLIRKSFMEFPPQNSGIVVIRDEAGNIIPTKCEIPLVTDTDEDGVIEIKTEGFMLPYDKFLNYLPSLQSFTGLRTVCCVDSGKNSTILYKATAKDMPSGIISYSKVPPKRRENEVPIGYTGGGILPGEDIYSDWLFLDLDITKHIMVLGNTNTGKGVFYRALMAGLPTDSIILIGDPVKDALDFRDLMYNPYELDKLMERRAQGISRKVLLEEKQKIEPIPTVVVADNKDKVFNLCQWVFKQALIRANICKDHNLDHIRKAGDVNIMGNLAIKFPPIFVFLDETAAYSISGSSKDQKAIQMKKILSNGVLTYRAFDIYFIMATQRGSVKAVDAFGGADVRDQFYTLSFYTSARNLEMTFERTIKAPNPGTKGEYKGTFVIEGHDGGIYYAKAPMLEQNELAYRIYKRQKQASDLTIQQWKECYNYLPTTGADKININRTSLPEFV